MGRPVIGVSSGKLNQSCGLAIASIGYDPHYVPASNYLCHVQDCVLFRGE